MAENSVTQLDDDGDRDRRVEAVIADYIRACEAGAPPDRRQILERHPQFADDLRQFFGQRDRMQQLAEPIRGFGDALFRALGPGQKINYVGNYELLEEIARGGMGVVYKARQSTLGRIVAVKMIVSGRLANEQDVQRFLAEAEAAASLRHPNIVSIHEVGLHEGWHYFSMDYVEGRDLAAILRQNPLPVKQAATYIRQMAEAIHYAHQQGTLHRDLKPSNVLVDEQDQIHITDFGLATRLEGESGLTRTGQILGTPSYMPPEQAQCQRALIGPASDIYALGAVLYECLTGRPPFRADSAVQTIQQVIHTEPASPRLLNPAVPRDLETICQKCLQKEPQRRYGTAQLLADDLQRFLDGRPILARRVASAERAWRWCRRNPIVAALSAVLLTLLIAVALGSSVAVVRIEAAREEATQNAAREAAARSQAEIHFEEAERQRQRAEVNFHKARQAVDEMYTQVAEKWLAQQPQLESVQREFLQKALGFYTEFAQETSSDLQLRLEAGTAFRRVADIQHKLGEPAQAELSYGAAVDRLQKLVDEFPEASHYRQNLADALHQLGVLFGDTGRYADEEKTHLRALELQEKLVVDFPEVPDHRRDLGRGYWFLGKTLNSLSRKPEAGTAFRRALSLQNRLLVDFPEVPEYRFHFAVTHLDLGNVLRHLNQPDSPRTEFEAALAILQKLTAEFPTVPEYRNELGGVLYWLSQVVLPEGADQPLLRQAIAVQEKLASEFPAVSNYRYDLLRSLHRLGKILSLTDSKAEAEKIYGRALEIGETLSSESPTVHYFRGRLGMLYSDVAWLLQATSRRKEAKAQYRQLIRYYDKLIADFPDMRSFAGPLSEAYFRHGLLLSADGEYEEAIRAHRRAIELVPKSFGVMHTLASLLVTLSDTNWRSPQEAVELSQCALALLREQGGEAWQVGDFSRTLGVAHYRAGEWKPAIAVLEKVSELQNGGTANDWFYLAMANRQLGHSDESRRWFRKAAAATEKISPDNFELLRLRTEATALCAETAVGKEPAATTSQQPPASPAALREPENALPFSTEPTVTFDATANALQQIAQMNVRPGDWPQSGGTSHRNNTPEGKNISTDWEFELGRDVKWSSPLGSQTYGNPVIANGKVFVGTNNGAGYVTRYPSTMDLGCLLCFDEQTGKFLWQHSNPKLPTGRVNDWPMQGICSTPYVDGDRLWYVTNRGEVVCLDTEGFQDFENDGPFKEDPIEEHGADVVWKLNMMTELRVLPHNMSNCSVTCAGDVLFVCTSNGVDESHLRMPQADAPSFIALDRNTATVLWTDNSPGANVLHGQWSSPTYGVFGGLPQVLFGGGDGWLYSFDPQGEGGKSKLLWKFDCNPKDSKYSLGGRSTRNHVVGIPVIYDDLIYVAVGEDPEHGEGQGHLWCIDPKKRGDVSPELVFNAAAPAVPVAPKRTQACERDKGDFTRINPNSAAVWEYAAFDRNGNDKLEFEETMHRAIGSVAIKDGLLFVVDFAGLFHCVDAKTGTPYWTHDLMAASWSSPLIVDNHVYVTDEDGDVTIFSLSKQQNVVATITATSSIYTTPVVANNVLFITAKDRLYAIEKGAFEERAAGSPLLASRKLGGHIGTVWGLAFSPDGKRLASGSDDKTIRMWDPKTGQFERLLTGHTAAVRSVEFSPDGGTLASAGHDKTVRLWDPADGQLKATIIDTALVYFPKFTKDGNILVTGSFDKNPRMWNVPERRLIRKLEGHEGTTWAVAVSAKTDLIATAGSDLTIRLWDAADGSLVSVIEVPIKLNALAFSPDGQILASAGSGDAPTRMWDPATGKLLKAFPAPAANVYDVAFSPDGKALASAGDEEVIRMWDVNNGTLLEEFSASGYSLSFSPDGTLLACGGGDGIVRIWELPAPHVVP